MGLWEKWLVRGIIKEELGKNKDIETAYKNARERIFNNLCGSRFSNNEKRVERISGYFGEIWAKLTGQTYEEEIELWDKYRNKPFK